MRSVARRSNRNPGPRTLTIQGPFGIGLQLPIAKLPIKVGSDQNLSANQSIYPVIHGLSVPIALQQIATATGALATGIGLSPSAVLPSFTSRLAAVFDEYCVTGALLEVRVVHKAGPAQGLVYVYMDEKDFGTPTSVEANASARIECLVNNSAMPVTHHIQWKASDVADLNWRSTSTEHTYSPVMIKVFSSNADTGTAATTDYVVYITGCLNLDVRGWRGN